MATGPTGSCHSRKRRRRLAPVEQLDRLGSARAGLDAILQGRWRAEPDLILAIAALVASAASETDVDEAAA